LIVFEFLALLNMLNEFTYFNINFCLAELGLGVILLLVSCLVQNEALYHVLGQDEASNREGYLLKEFVVLDADGVGHVHYQHRIKELLCKHQNKHWENQVPHLEGFIALIHFFLYEFIKLIAKELSDVPKQVFIDAFISSSSFEIDGLFVISFLRFLNLCFYGFFDVNFEFESILIQDQFAGFLLFVLVNHD
jgi:hypothetical protein